MLRDPHRREVYDMHGFSGLVRSEGMTEEDVFDADPWDVFERFFAGEEEEDRQYLLLHGGGDDSDEDEEEDDDDDMDAAVAGALGGSGNAVGGSSIKQSSGLHFNFN